MKHLLCALLLFITPLAEGAAMSQMERIQYVFTHLSANNLEILDPFYDKQVHFQDPLGTHNSLESAKAYYAGLYKNVTAIKFDFTDTLSDGNKHLLVWTMHLRAKGLNSGKEISVAGNSVIIFNDNNLVSYHRDYFDMGEFIYEQLPVLGWIIRKVKQRLS